jgi:hypothetical protein
MPITIDQFETQFNKLQASFGSMKSPKILDQWYEEFNDLEYFPFLNAMKRLQYGQKFPTWEMFKAEYRNCLGVQVKTAYKGCDHCSGGVVLFRDIHPKSKQVSDQAANCSLCSLNRIRDMANVNPSQLFEDSMGTLRTRRALALDLENGVGIDSMPSSKPQNINKIVQDVFGKDDPVQERQRYGSLKREELRETL